MCRVFFYGTDVDIVLYSVSPGVHDVYNGTVVDIVLYSMLLDLQDVCYGTDVDIVLYSMSPDVQMFTMAQMSILFYI